MERVVRLSVVFFIRRFQPAGIARLISPAIVLVAVRVVSSRADGALRALDGGD
jgi:hypothetical protein